MSISTPPPPQKKKSGCGCFGCGCLVVIILIVLFFGLVGAGGYFGYQKALTATSTVAADVPSFNGSDELYDSTRQKIADAQTHVQNHQSVDIRLSADEINTLIARTPMGQGQNHLFVSMKDTKGRLQGSIALNSLFQGKVFKDRFFNFDTSLSLTFNPDTKLVSVTLHNLQMGDYKTPPNLIPTMQTEFTTILNMQFQKSPDIRALLDQAQNITIQDGQLVIQTK